jgi:hypothetical protein
LCLDKLALLEPRRRERRERPMLLTMCVCPPDGRRNSRRAPLRVNRRTGGARR